MTDNKKILLHACCGPCLVLPARQLQAENRSFLAWFHNPNIHPPVEHERRLEAFWQIARTLQIEGAADSKSDPEPWVNWSGPPKERCRMCYRRRLQAAAKETARRKMAAFSSTLLISPWQDREAIVSLGEAAGQDYGVEFIPFDWRAFYRQGQQLAREAKVYRQRYCGCLPSIADSRYAQTITKELEALEASPELSDNGRR